MSDNKVYTLDKLEIELMEIINLNCVDYNFTKVVIDAIYKKGLDGKILFLIINENITFRDLSILEKVCLTEAIYQATKIEDVNPGRYFSDKELMEYDTFIPEKEESVDTITIEEAKYISDRQYTGFLDAKELLKIKDNMLVTYNRKTQRKGNVKKMGRDIIHEIEFDRDLVEEIKSDIRKGKFIPTLITFNILAIEDKVPQFAANKVEGTKGIYNIEIKPEFDRNSNKTTYCDITDGYHRYVAITEIAREYINAGKELDNGLGLLVSLTILSIEEAKHYVATQFKRADTSKEFLKAIEDNDYNRFVDSLEKASNLLKGRIATTRDELISEKYLISKNQITDIVKIFNVEVNNVFAVKFAVDRIAKTLETLHQYYINIEIDDATMKILQSSIFIQGYITLGLAIESSDNLESIMKFGDNILDIIKDKNAIKDIKKLKGSKLTEYFLSLM